MKLFSYIGIAGTIWASYIVLRNKNMEAGFADLKRRLMVNVDVPKPVDKTTITKVDAIPPADIAKAVNDHIDWQDNPEINSSVDAFTKDERIANQAWPNGARTMTEWHLGN